MANLAFTDVRASNTFAKEAIWETGALELMKGYAADTGTTRRFGLNDTLSVEQALALSYIAAGREAEAQAAAGNAGQSAGGEPAPVSHPEDVVGRVHPACPQ